MLGRAHRIHCSGCDVLFQPVRRSTGGLGRPTGIGTTTSPKASRGPFSFILPGVVHPLAPLHLFCGTKNVVHRYWCHTVTVALKLSVAGR